MNTTGQEVRYLRYEHGGHPVWISSMKEYGENRHSRKISVGYPQGEVEYSSFRSLLTDVVGKPISGLTFDRYFREQEEEQAYCDWTSLLVDKPKPKPKGIDLKNRSKEVEKLMYAGYGKMIYHSGYDPEDVLQEVYRGILARNKGKCPWDKKKSSFGHYVHMVIGCIIKNYHRKRRKWTENEQSGVPSFSDTGKIVNVDVASSQAAVVKHYSTTEAGKMAKRDLMGHILRCFGECENKETVKSVVEMMLAGHTQVHISQEISMPRSKVSKLVKQIREFAKTW